MIWRRQRLASEHRLDSLISREAMFLLQNMVLLAITFVIFWVTLFPLISQAVTGTKVSVGPPAFTPFVVPLALILVLLSGVGPLISWRRATAANLRRHFIFPVCFGVLVTILVLALTDAGRKPLAVAMFGLRRVRDRHRAPGVLPRHRGAAGDDPGSPGRWHCWRWCAATAGATAATSPTSGSR